MTTTSRPENILGAAFWVGGAILSFCVIAVAGRALLGTLSSVEIMVYRSLVGFAIVCAVAIPRGFKPWQTKRLPLHLTRNMFHFYGQTMWLVGLTYLPLAQLVSLEFSSPIWVILLSPLILGEALTQRKLIAVALGFVGILLISRPGVIALNPGHAAGLTCAIGFAITTMVTKRLSSTDGLWTILFYMTLCQSVFAIVLSFIFAGEGGPAVPGLDLLPWVILIGIGGLSAHLCLTSALQRAPASTVAPMEFMRLPAMALLGMVVYNEAFEIWVVLGAALILAGNLYNRPRARVIPGDTPK
ncbi:DMT family transporter [Paracoccaceae bacterium GXU_MW_L88]